MLTLSAADARVVFAKFGTKLWVNGEAGGKAVAPQRTMELADVPTSKILWTARSLVNWLYAGNDVESYAWVRDWGVWPDSENYHLFYIWRKNHRCMTSIQMDPCHYFLQGEQLDCVDLTYMSLLFGWDALLITSWGDRAAALSHDGAVTVAAIDGIALDAVADLP